MVSIVVEENSTQPKRNPRPSAGSRSWGPLVMGFCGSTLGRSGNSLRHGGLYRFVIARPATYNVNYQRNKEI